MKVFYASTKPKFGYGADLQYDGVVEADVGERPVHYHHVRVEDFPPQLQQAEHGATVELYGDEKKNAIISATLIKSQGCSQEC